MSMLQITPEQLAQLALRAEQNARELALPASADIVAKIAVEVQKSGAEPGATGKLVEQDPALAAVLLKTVNAAIDGLVPAARSVQQALGYLGQQAAASLLSRLVRRHAFSPPQSSAVSELGNDAARLATALGFLGRALGIAPRDEAYTFGLFRDAGRIVLVCRHADYFERMGPIDEHDATACTDREKRYFGADHAVIGAVLARDWLLPEAMSDAILWHHAEFVLALDAPPIRDEAVRLIALGALGDRVLARYAKLPPERVAKHSAEQALRVLGTNARHYSELETEALSLLAAREGLPMPTMRLGRLNS
jgi:HD-like signal output (HDOD) protein